MYKYTNGSMSLRPKLKCHAKTFIIYNFSFSLLSKFNVLQPIFVYRI